MAVSPADRTDELAGIFLDESAFRGWYDAVAPRVYAYLYGRCGGQTAVAEELTQQTFLQAVRHRDTYDGRADSVTWLIAIARNRLADHYRRLEREERRHLRLIVREIDVGEPGVQAWRSRDERADVLAALRRLPAAQSAALILRYVDGLSVRGVADALGRSEKAVESLITWAREAFRTAFEYRDDG